MLTDNERSLVRLCLEEYPARTDVATWGWGPMEVEHYLEQPLDVLEKYG